MDLGCGTGISTRLFATTGHPVIGIDPNADMLATARLPPVGGAEGAQDYRVGTSEHTGLPDACADLIIAAQAFHLETYTGSPRIWRDPATRPEAVPSNSLLRNAGYMVDALANGAIIIVVDQGAVAVL